MLRYTVKKETFSLSFHVDLEPNHDPNCVGAAGDKEADSAIPSMTLRAVKVVWEGIPVVNVHMLRSMLVTWQVVSTGWGLVGLASTSTFGATTQCIPV